MKGFFAGRMEETLRRALSLLGLTERRCVCCREPFEPVSPGGSSAALSDAAVVELFFCPACRKAFRRREAGYCPCCGEPSALEDAPCMPCASCLKKLPPWQDFLFFGIYAGPFRELVLRAKFHGSLAALEVLGRLLAGICAGHYAVTNRPDVIIPMPLHRKRLHERGFNQCRELARPVAEVLGVPVRTDILVKKLALKPQSSLTREERMALKQPFAAVRPVDGLHVLLIDDVCTTGSTLARATEALLAAGASRVDVAVLARSSRHESRGPGEGEGPVLP